MIEQPAVGPHAFTLERDQGRGATVNVSDPPWPPSVYLDGVLVRESPLIERVAPNMLRITVANGWATYLVRYDALTDIFEGELVQEEHETVSAWRRRFDRGNRAEA